MEELIKADLLMDGEVAIQPEGFEQPFVYRGFRMVDEEKLRNLRGDELRKMNQNGMLPLDLRPPLLAERDARRVRPADAAGQGAGAGAAAGAGDRLGRLFGGGRELAAEQRFAELDGKRVDEGGATRSKPGPGSRSARRDSSGGRSPAGAHERRVPGARDAR